MFQREVGERMRIKYLWEGFHEALGWFQVREVVLITEGVDVGENMRLRRLFRVGSTTEVLNRGLYMEVIEAKNQWRNMDRGRGRGGGGVKHDGRL